MKPATQAEFDRDILNAARAQEAVKSAPVGSPQRKAAQELYETLRGDLIAAIEHRALVERGGKL